MNLSPTCPKRNGLLLFDRVYLRGGFNTFCRQWNCFKPPELPSDFDWTICFMPRNPKSNNGFPSISQISPSPMWCELSFQHNWSDFRSFKYWFQVSLLLNKFNDILLRWAWIRSSWKSPFVTNRLHTTRCPRNQTCNNETQHSRCVASLVFAMHRALIVSARIAGIKVCPCSICSWNWRSLKSIFVRLLGNKSYPKIANSMAKTRYYFHSSSEHQKAELFFL